MTHHNCPVCNSQQSRIFIELLNLPIYCNLLWSDQQAARDCPKGDLRLAFCDRCSAITNVAFDPSRLDYSQDYENALHYSKRFQAYADALAKRLVERHHLQGKTVIEIGCGKGDFLVSLCQLGQNSGIGFDSSYVERAEHTEEKITFIQDFYSERYAEYQGDFICCRQVLEHIQRPADLLQPLRENLRKKDESTEIPVFFEVPNALYTFQNMMIWDIIYEHCTYFTPTALSYVFTAAGYRPEAVTEEFGGQFISVEAYASPTMLKPIAPEEEISALATDITHFEARFKAQKQQWEHSLNLLFQQGKKVVIWGSGSKGVTFLNLLNIHDEIAYAVDINPRKQNKFIPGTGQEIISPERLAAYQPDAVIVMNPLYATEIKEMLAQMNLSPQILTTESFRVNP